MADTYYKILSVDPKSSDPEIRKAYMSAVRTWHPDWYTGDLPEEADNQIREVNKAWETLGDPDKRRLYDQKLQTESLSPQPSVVVDSQFFDPERLQKQRQSQDRTRTVSPKHLRILRTVPLVLFLFVVSVIALTFLSGGGSSVPERDKNPLQLGVGIDRGDCVSVLTGPSLIEMPCGNTADGIVLAAVEAAGLCPEPASMEIVLQNNVVACLGER